MMPQFLSLTFSLILQENSFKMLVYIVILNSLNQETQLHRLCFQTRHILQQVTLSSMQAPKKIPIEALNLHNPNKFNPSKKSKAFDSQNGTIIVQSNNNNQFSMINQYESEGLSESYHRHECQLYDDLSTLMQIFKKLLTSIEEIAFNIQQQYGKQTPQQRLKYFSKSLESLLTKYSQQSQQFRIETRTFQRFVCRLFETIELHELKHRDSNSFESNFMVSTLTDIDIALRQNECMHNLVKLIRTIKLIVDKFVHFQLAIVAKNQAPTSAGNDRSIGLMERIDARFGRINSLKKHRLQVKEEEKEESEEEEADNDDIRSLTVSQPKLNLPINNSITRDLQKRFQLYRNLELDFFSFKASYFSAKSNPEGFYKQYLQRNLINARIISDYKDDFCLFQKKKLSKYHRRLVSNKKSDQNGSDVDRGINLSQVLTKQNKSSKEGRNQKGRVAIIHNQNPQQEQREEEYHEKNKTSYKMKNVYLTFGKKLPKNTKNPKMYGSITPNILKHKHQFQSIYLNHQRQPKNELSITQSIDLDTSQLKAVSAIKASQRIKTSPDKSILGEKGGEWKDTTKRMKQAEIPIRAVNKKRYLQVDCTPKKEISLNKVILTGNANPRHIKLSKINQQKGHNLLF